jgi:hypothetical protein
MGFFPVSKVDHSHPFSADVKERRYSVASTVCFRGLDKDNLINSGRLSVLTAKQQLKFLLIIWANLMFYRVNITTDITDISE